MFTMFIKETICKQFLLFIPRCVNPFVSFQRAHCLEAFLTEAEAESQFTNQIAVLKFFLNNLKLKVNFPNNTNQNYFKVLTLKPALVSSN